jgi:hypothetical protein
LVNGDDEVAAFTRDASRVETLAVIDRQSRGKEGSRSILASSRSQSSAESSACSLPNNSLTALKNADNSCSAAFMRPEDAGFDFFDGA